MGFLYRLLFPNGKSYVGITTKSAEIRFSAHKANAFCSFKKGANNKRTPLYAAWRKHGEPKLIVIAEMENHSLAAAEVAAIAEFNCVHPNGYNLTPGGEVSPMTNPLIVAKMKISRAGFKPSRESIERGAAKRRGRTLSEDHKKKLSERRKGAKFPKMWRENIKAAKQNVSSETRAKLSAALKGRKLSGEHIKKVLCARASFSVRRRNLMRKRMRASQQARRAREAAQKGEI